MKQRLASYKSDVKSGRHDKIYLYRAFRDHGFDNFRFDVIIEDIETPSELNYAEKYMIAYHKSNDKKIGYNCTEGGDGTRMMGKDNPHFGVKKPWLGDLNRARRGTKLSEEHKQKIDPTGRKHSAETIIKMKSVRRTPEFKENIGIKNSKKTLCDGLEFESVTVLANYLGVTHQAISHSLRRGNKVHGHIISRA